MVSRAQSRRSAENWTVADAKAHLSEVMERAQAVPQIITRHGRPFAVVVSVDEWSRKTTRQGTLAQFLMNSPLRGAEPDLTRTKEQPRDLDL